MRSVAATLVNQRNNAYDVCMANKVSSAPLFGAPTSNDVEAIQRHMREFTAKAAKSARGARRLLEEAGAIAPAKVDGAVEG